MHKCGKYKCFVMYKIITEIKYLSSCLIHGVNIGFSPSTNAIMALTFANNLLEPLFPNCPINPLSQKLIAAITICKYIDLKLTCLVIYLFILFGICVSAFVKFFFVIIIYNTNSMHNFGEFSNYNRLNNFTNSYICCRFDNIHKCV